MGKKQVEVVEYPKMPESKSQIDEKYIMDFVKDKGKMEWLRNKLEEYKSLENSTSKFTSLRADFFGEFIKPNLPKSNNNSSSNKTKFQILQDFVNKNNENQ